MGNAPHSEAIISALQARLGLDENLDIHIQWAIKQQSLVITSNRKEQRLIRIIEKGLPRDA